jgi:hypothetical protein
MTLKLLTLHLVIFTEVLTSLNLSTLLLSLPPSLVLMAILQVEASILTLSKGRRLAMLIATRTLMLHAQGSANKSNDTRLLYQQKRR